MCWKRLAEGLIAIETDMTQDTFLEVLQRERFDPPEAERAAAGPTFSDIIRRARASGLQEIRAPMTLDIKIGDWTAWATPPVKEDDLPSAARMGRIVDWIRSELQRKQIKAA